MRIAFLVDQIPFPPCNGVTIPVSQACLALAQEGHEVHVFLFEEEFLGRQKNIQVDKYLFETQVIIRYRSSILRRIVDEILLRRPAYMNWKYAEDLPSLETYDVICASPISVLAEALSLRNPKQRVVAIINDIYTAVLRSDNYFDGTVRSILTQLISRFRSVFSYILESRELIRCDSVIVQTSKDKQWAHRIGGDDLTKKVVCFHNSVSQDIIDSNVEYITPGPTVVFVGDLRGKLYQKNLLKFLEYWVDVQRCVPEATLRIVGGHSNVDADFLRQVKQYKNVILTGFVKDLRDAYAGARVAIAPIFKQYGFINKVAEAAAMGVPVLGDKSAFNGIEQLLARGGALSFDNWSEVPDLLKNLITDDIQWRVMSENSRSVAVDLLNPSNRNKKLSELIIGTRVN